MKSGVLVLALTLISLLSFAQVERKTAVKDQADSVSTASFKEQAGKNDRKQMIKDLHLTREQQAKMKEIHQSGRSKKEALLNDNKLTNEDRQAKLRVLQKEQFDNTMHILNDEQKQKMRNGKANMIKNREMNEVNQ